MVAHLARKLINGGEMKSAVQHTQSVSIVIRRVREQIRVVDQGLMRLGIGDGPVWVGKNEWNLMQCIAARSHGNGHSCLERNVA